MLAFGLRAEGETLVFTTVAFDGSEPQWKFRVGSGVVGNPMTYIGPDGKQYVAIYAGGRTTTVNPGFLAIAFAWIIGVYLGRPPIGPKGVIAGFPTDLFLTLVSVTLLFAQAQGNGTLDRVARIPDEHDRRRQRQQRRLGQHAQPLPPQRLLGQN